MTTHVVVVGAGIIGLAAARELAARGAQVTVLERHLAGAGTSSRGEGNLLVSDKEQPDEVRLALRSLQLWAELAQASPVPFEYEPKGGIITASSASQLTLLRAQAGRQRTLGITSAELDAAGLRELEPTISPALLGGISFAQDAQIMPVHAVRALRALALGLGAAERVGADVIGLQRLSTGLRVRLADGGHLDADAVVLAAGPWSGEVAQRLGGSAAVFPRRGLLLVTEPLPPGTVRHKVYDGRYVEAVASDEAAAQVAPVIESTPSGTILIGSTREAVGWDSQQPWDLVGALARSAAALFPRLGRARIIRTYQGFRPATPDHLPLIGPDALVEGLFHCSGHEGAGIGLALASAELLADAVLAGRVDAAFDPRRLDASASAPDPPAPAPTPFTLAPPGAPPSLPRPPTGSAPAGSTLAAAMLAQGRSSWRRTRFAELPRGLYCGIGHCHDCVLVAPDGTTDRACLMPASQSAAPPPVDLDTDVVIVGAGPAGLAAASAVAGDGVGVALIDRHPRAGGQVGRQPADADSPGGPWGPLITAGTGAALHLTDTQVVAVQRVAAASPPGARRFQLLVDTTDRLGVVAADHVLLATGGREVVRPFPGWTLPGVVTAGAAQALAKREGRLPWSRIVLAGSGPLLLAVAAALRDLGTPPLLTLESQHLARLAAGGLPVGLRNPGKLADLARLTRGRLPRFGWRVVAADGGQHLDQVVVRTATGRTHRLGVDALAVSDGLVPDLTLAAQLGCATVDRPGTAGAAVAIDELQATSIEGVWAAGELTGVGGGDKAVAEGRLAGAAIRASMGGPAPSLTLRAAVRGWHRFRDALAGLYPWEGSWAADLADDVDVCRCEEVPAGRVRGAMDDGASTARAVKGLTRCGMGRCQGRVCGPLLSTMLRAAGHPTPGDLESRPIAQPVLVEQLARLLPATATAAGSSSEPEDVGDVGLHLR